MIPFKFRLKALVPGYKNKWRRGSAVMLDHFKKLAPRILFERDGDIPWIEVQDKPLRFHGFWSNQKELLENYMWGDELPQRIPKEYHRLVKDYVTRYMYPHMRPDLGPSNVRPANWGGFHGQHKEGLDDYSGGNKEELLQAFTPKPNDVIVNGGSFLGFGDLHVSPLVPEGHIYSIEADADSFVLLQKNLKYNQIQNVTALHRALWNEDTTLELDVGPAQANTLITQLGRGKATQEVRTITIDGLVEEQGLSKLDMISLTLNGAEVETLEGAAKTLENLKPRIRLPGWYLRDGVPIWKLTKDTLEKKGLQGVRGPARQCPGPSLKAGPTRFPAASPRAKRAHG